MAGRGFFRVLFPSTRKATYPKIINYQTIQDNFIYERNEWRNEKKNTKPKSPHSLTTVYSGDTKNAIEAKRNRDFVPFKK